MSYSARVILDSVGPNGSRLTTFELVIPRIVLAEFNTHRMFSRNSASSRAIPVEKMLARVKEHPFVPSYWGKNQKGMQADEELGFAAKKDARDLWLEASQHALEYASALSNLGVHKQITNRLLEPFMWHTVIFTATELDNFIALRNSKMAAPEIAEPARLLVEAYEKSTPMKLEAGEWHLPLVTGYDVQSTTRTMGDYSAHSYTEWFYWAKISAARCARTSYLTHEGVRDLAEDIALYEKLVTSGHMSPLEHPAKALTREQWSSVSRDAFFKWWDHRVPVGNFYGWQQFRKTIDKEHDAKLFSERIAMIHIHQDINTGPRCGATTSPLAPYVEQRNLNEFLANAKHYGLENDFCPTCAKIVEGELSGRNPDPVNHPKHYNVHPSGVECIQIIEHMGFNLGNAMKYLWRAGHKDATPTDQDLAKAIWYIERERKRIAK